MIDRDIRIGDVLIDEISVGPVRASTEAPGAVWLTAPVTLWFFRPGHSRAVSLEAGCWLGTDNDHDVWCSDREGARAIAAYLGSEAESDIRALLPDAVAELGDAICAAVRQAYRAQSGG